jgi:hypothetical protein
MKDAEKTTSNEQLLSPLQKQAGEALQFCDELIHDFKARAARRSIYTLSRGEEE